MAPSAGLDYGHRTLSQSNLKDSLFQLMPRALCLLPESRPALRAHAWTEDSGLEPSLRPGLSEPQISEGRPHVRKELAEVVGLRVCRDGVERRTDPGRPGPVGPHRTSPGVSLCNPAFSPVRVRTDMCPSSPSSTTLFVVSPEPKQQVKRILIEEDVTLDASCAENGLKRSSETAHRVEQTWSTELDCWADRGPPVLAIDGRRLLETGTRLPRPRSTSSLSSASSLSCRVSHGRPSRRQPAKEPQPAVKAFKEYVAVCKSAMPVATASLSCLTFQGQDGPLDYKGESPRPEPLEPEPEPRFLAQGKALCPSRSQRKGQNRRCSSANSSRIRVGLRPPHVLIPSAPTLYVGQERGSV